MLSSSFSLSGKNDSSVAVRTPWHGVDSKGPIVRTFPPEM